MTRVEEAEEQISHIEDRIRENNEAEQKRKKTEDHGDRLRELGDSIKHNSIRIIGVPEELERERAIES